MMDDSESNESGPEDKDVSYCISMYVNIQYFLFKFLG